LRCRRNDKLIETVQGTIGIFTPKPTGTTSVTDSFSDFWFNQGSRTSVSATSGLSDPIVVWDDQVNRFIVGQQDTDNTNHLDAFYLAVSKSASPTTLTGLDWNFYTVTTTESNRNADYPGNFGYNHDAFVFTLNQNSTAAGTDSDVQVTSIKISDLIAGNPITPFENDYAPFATRSSGQFTLRPTVMHDSVAGDPMWLLWSQNGGGSSLNVVKMTNILSNTATFATTTLSVNSYSSVVQPLQPDGTGIPPASGNGADWTHIFEAAEYNNTIVASDNISVSSTEDDARWYEIDVSGATPTLKDQGNVSAGNNTYIAYPSIGINANGYIGMTYLESGTGTNQYLSMYVTGRAPGDAAGTMQTPVLVKAGVSNDKTGREGDLTGINVDTTPLTVTPPPNQTSAEGASIPISLGSFADTEGDFFAADEYAAAGGQYGTAVGEFSLQIKGPWSIDVKWGDGTADTMVNTSTPGSIGPFLHIFGEEGIYTVKVTVTDTADNHSDSKTFQVTVSDQAVAGKGGFAVTATEGALSTTQTVATFTDPGGAEPNPSDPTDGIASHYTTTIAWGDSTASAGLITYSGATGSTTDPFTISGNHTYGEEGIYTITVTIDHEGMTTKVTSTATVSDPAVLAKGVPVFAVVCTTPFTAPVATYTDPGGAEPNPSDPTDGIPSHYTATIDWGDSTPASAGAITYSGAPGSKTDSFTVSGSHAYAKEGIYTVTTTIDHEGIITKTTSTATVKDDLGLLLLDPTGSMSLMVTGNGSVTATGCGAVVVDSNDASDAAFLSGHGKVTAFDVDVTGGVQVTGQASLGPVEHEAATPDPLGLALPAPPSPTFAAVHYSGSAALTLSPGTYVGGIQITGSGPVTFLPGVYFMEGGGFSVSGQGSVSGTGVVIINAPTAPSDTISITGQGSVTLTAPTSGAFQGVVMFQNPNSSNPVQFTGQGAVTLTGVVYVPDAPVSITGQGIVTINHGPGTATLPPILGALIAFDLKVDGNGALTINPDDPAGGATAPPGGRRGGGSSFQRVAGLTPAPVQPSGVPHADSNRLGLLDVTGANPLLQDQVFAGNSGGMRAVRAGDSSADPYDQVVAQGLDLLDGQLVNELAANLGEGA
jgi:hypothetical protein